MIIKGNLLIEYNVRMGDPECQTILPNKSDFGRYCCINKNLKSINLDWYNDKSLCGTLFKRISRYL